MTQSNESLTEMKYLKLDPPVSYLTVGQLAQVKAYAVFANGRQAEVTAEAVWSMPETNVGTVSEGGIVSAKSPGSAMLAAQYGEHRAESIIVSIGKQDEPEQKNGTWGRMIVRMATAVAAVLISGAVYIHMTQRPEDSSLALQTTDANPAEVSGATEAVGKQTAATLEPGERKIETEQSSQGALVMAERQTNVTPPSPVTETTQPPASLPAPRQVTKEPQPLSMESAKPTNRNDSAKKRSIPTTAPAAAKTKPKLQPVSQQTAPPKARAEQTSKSAAAAVTATPEKSTHKTSALLKPVEKDGKWGYARQFNTFEQELVIPYQYDHATGFSDGLALVKKDGKFGYIDQQGKLVIGFRFDYATPFRDGAATVKKDGTLRQIDKSGEFID
jgi:hypothetical protein